MVSLKNAMKLRSNVDGSELAGFRDGTLIFDWYMVQNFSDDQRADTIQTHV